MVRCTINSDPIKCKRFVRRSRSAGKWRSVPACGHRLQPRLGELAVDLRHQPLKARLVLCLRPSDENVLGVGCPQEPPAVGGVDARAVRFVDLRACRPQPGKHFRSEEHTSELQSLMRTSYAVIRLKKKTPSICCAHYIITVPLGTS